MKTMKNTKEERKKERKSLRTVWRERRDREGGKTTREMRGRGGE